MAKEIRDKIKAGKKSSEIEKELNSHDVGYKIKQYREVAKVCTIQKPSSVITTVLICLEDRAANALAISIVEDTLDYRRRMCLQCPLDAVFLKGQ